ncbi:MAG: DUF2279 domain-containing protein [Desulfuromonas sp.]|nr:MAG: DUF2279 domain-containing protein [Desulfuromonas sp.]
MKSSRSKKGIHVVMRCLLIPLALIFLLPVSGFSYENVNEVEGLSRSTKTTLLNAGVASGIVVWGIANWDYFACSPHTDNEGWFGSNTKEGGADKFGHMYSGHLLTGSFTAIYRHWGYEEKVASRYGLLSSIGMTTIMEVGDAFSEDYGFSYEDMIMNLLGAGIGYMLETRPEISKKLDFRWEYWPSLGDFQGDILTDYEHSRYLFAIKGEGFDFLQGTLGEYIELHVGFYARERDSSRDENRRTNRYLYSGVGINLGRLLRPLWETRLFEFWQPAYTYIPIRKGLD